MAKKDGEKRSVLLLVALSGLFVVSGWIFSLTSGAKAGGLYILSAILTLAFSFTGRLAIKNIDDPNKDWSRVLSYVLALATGAILFLIGSQHRFGDFNF